MQNTEEAYKWIVGLLHQENIPFQISGGFAARLYGSDRPLYDIDIEIHDEDFAKLLPFVKEKIIYGPDRYKDETFELLLMTLKYDGQEIDICGCDSDLLFNQETKEWESCGTDIAKAVEKEVYGVKVPIVAWQNLVAYKKKIRRPTDLEDVMNIESKFSLITSPNNE